MLLIALALVVSGVVNTGAVAFALVCTATMAVMMVGMGHGNNNKRQSRHRHERTIGALQLAKGGNNERWRITVMWWYPGWGWGAWLGMSLMMLVFWGAVVWLIVTLMRKSSKQDVGPPPRQAKDMLAERFARGEIDEAEYQDRLRVLQGTPAGPPTRLDKTERVDDRHRAHYAATAPIPLGHPP